MRCSVYIRTYDSIKTESYLFKKYYGAQFFRISVLKRNIYTMILLYSVSHKTN